jgi:tRNA threonylcarbamoyladenosine biosynthesis protein TsaE
MPILDVHSMEFISRSAEQTRRLGMRLGALLRTGDMVCLVGDLGAGKTTFVQGIGSGWGSLDAVSSPTFVLVNVYRRRGANRTEERLYHLDSYRLSGPAEADDLDLEALIEEGPLVIEWAERIETVLPPEGLWVRLRWIEENQRDLVFSARGQRYERMLAALRRQLFGVT